MDVDLTDIISRINALESEYRRINMFPNAQVIAGTAPRPETSSSTYEELWRGDFYAAGQILHYDFFAFPNGYTMAFRILCYQLPTGTPTTILETTGITVAAQYAGTIDLSTASAGFIANTGTNPLGRYFTLRYEAKITAGGPGQVGIGVIAAPYVLKA